VQELAPSFNVRPPRHRAARRVRRKVPFGHPNGQPWVTRRERGGSKIGRSAAWRLPERGWVDNAASHKHRG
jgi:hypothetical protein